ncbi:hypothetical protein AYY19_14465 [Photobacterium aquimaris]|uniref:DUF305 domain-containing protein n=1 Tax=Photobacterium aquimaris TaxID=512643 RepID=A0A2T3IQZ4_9GAMM|nr:MULTISPECIES: DUF305 domain-containing protein [Photobacterium]OBU16841.1 hypothetical protein AYY19_14465 [Photobacterium aquimaris]OBU21810.1 hypothetical protein AYY20_13690 [Photobacterium aquimaris]PSU30755.1 DUF305 domain-containing protein [Photobacterium aquimaris]PSW00066.1 DUF305 domain-containing protein [Photobacterium aquimaris]
MKKSSIAVLFSALLSTTAFATDTVAEHSQHMPTINLAASKTMMDDSMAAMSGMHSLKLTGDPDLDFIAGMLPHHEGAIVMSESILPTLTDPAVHQLALDIIKSQKAEVIYMKQWLASHKELPLAQRDMANSKEMMIKSMKIMHNMMEVKLTGNPNIDFMAGMLPHHEAAVEMAEVIMPYLKDQSTKTFATAIIKAQLKEIAFMKTWLKAHAPAMQKTTATKSITGHDHH